MTSPSGPPNPADHSGRHHPAHGVFASTTLPTIVYVTVCTKARHPWLVSDLAHRIIRNAWSVATAWRVGRYVLMPDHAHFFCAPSSHDITLENWIAFWKRHTSRHAPDPRWRWQSDHWDTRLRRSESYEAKWGYIRNNPLRAGLIIDPDAWPYQGELHTLPW